MNAGLAGLHRGVCPARRQAAYPPSLSHRPGRPEIGPTRPRSARAGQHRSADSTRRPSRPGPDSTRPGVHRKRRSCRSRLAAAVLAAAAAAARAWRSRWDPVQVRQSISSARARAASLLVRASYFRCGLQHYDPQASPNDAQACRGES